MLPLKPRPNRVTILYDRKRQQMKLTADGISAVVVIVAAIVLLIAFKFLH